MTPEFLIHALSAQDIPLLEKEEDEAALQKVCHDILDPVLDLLKAQKSILSPKYQNNPEIIEKIRVSELEIGSTLSHSLLPEFAERLGAVGPRLAKLVFDELKSREFDDAALVTLVRGLMEALEPAFIVEDSEGETCSENSNNKSSNEEGAN